MTWISVYSVMSSLPIKQALLSTIHGTQKQWKMQGCQPQRTVNKLLSLLCVSFINSEWAKGKQLLLQWDEDAPGPVQLSSLPSFEPCLPITCHISCGTLTDICRLDFSQKWWSDCEERKKNMESFTPISFYDLKIILVHFDIITLMLKNLLSSL